MCSKLCLPRGLKTELQETLYFILLMGLQRGDWGRAQPVPGASPHGQRMMERRDADPARAVLWKPQGKAFPPHEPEGLTAELEMEQAASERGSHPQSSGAF